MKNVSNFLHLCRTLYLSTTIYYYQEKLKRNSGEGVGKSVHPGKTFPDFGRNGEGLEPLMHFNAP